MFDSCLFIKNEAILNGGAIQFSNSPFLQKNCKFLQNKALYGENNGSYPLILRFSQKTINITKNSSKIQNVPTGRLLEFPIEIEICDIYNQKINTLTNSKN